MIPKNPKNDLNIQKLIHKIQIVVQTNPNFDHKHPNVDINDSSRDLSNLNFDSSDLNFDPKNPDDGLKSYTCWFQKSKS